MVCRFAGRMYSVSRLGAGKRRQFAFSPTHAVYGYVGVSSMLLRNDLDDTFVLAYFVFTAIAMIVMLVQIARRFGRSE